VPSGVVDDQIEAWTYRRIQFETVQTHDLEALGGYVSNHNLKRLWGDEKKTRPTPYKGNTVA
jgi:hypothetical protein